MINLRSDTVTKPTNEMREASANATVGDDVHYGDPTVKELESTFADLVEKEESLFVPSGTMGNQIAAYVHTEPGQECIVEIESHIYKWELAGLAQHSQLQVRPIQGTHTGAISPDVIKEAIVERDSHRSETGLICLENTHNSYGGTVSSTSAVSAVCDVAHDHAIPVHVDGARLFNAAAALDVPASELLADVDSVMCCLSKGLGAPVGSMLAGSSSFIAEARRVRKLFGGGMRQVGIIAAPGIIALDNRNRLTEDHQKATRLASGINQIDGLSASEPETNIVLVKTHVSASTFLEQCKTNGVLGSEFGANLVRFCTHMDISDNDIENAITLIASAV